MLRPVVERAESLPDPQEAFRATRPAYEAAYAAGLTTLFLPRELGGGGLSQVDFLIAVEELCAVDPGFATTLLVNGLALKPLLWAAPRSCGTGGSGAPPVTPPVVSWPGGR